MSRFIWAMLWRETRASWKRQLLFVLSIAAGVGGLVAVKSFSYGMEEAIRVEARSLMASDLSLSSHRTFDSAEREALRRLESRGAEVTYNTGFAAMALVLPGERAHLVDVRAVGKGYPFYGEVETRSGRSLRELLRDDTVLVHPVALTQLGVRVGERLRIGEREFRIAGVIKREPDRPVQFLALGPQVLMTDAGGRATGLIQPTSHVHYQALVKLPPPFDPLAVARELKENLPGRSARIRAYDESQPRVRRFLDRLTDYLKLVGLAALMLGGIGVSGAIRSFLGQKMDTLAILKCLGATSRHLFAVYLLQSMALGLAGSFAGAAIGLGAQIVLLDMLSPFLPTTFAPAISLQAALEGVLLGLITTLWFALPPLLLVRRVRPARVFRRQVEAAPAARLRHTVLSVVSALVLVGGLAVWQLGASKLTAIALGGLVATFLVLQFAAWGALLLLRRLPKPASFVWKQGLASLYRPGNQTSAIVVSLGLGVLLVLAVFLIQHDLLRQVTANPPERQPNLFLIDIQKSQREEVGTLLAETGAQGIEMIPVVRGRMRALNGERLQLDKIANPELRRILGFEFAFTYRGALSDGESLIEGRFERDPAVAGAQVSIAEWWADATGLGPGDTVTVDIQGIPVHATITSVRHIDWTNRRANFSFVFLPGALEKAPQMFVAAVRVEGPERQADLQRKLVMRLPNVSVIDIAAILRSIQEIIDRIGTVIQFMAVFCIAVGLVILMGAIGTTKYERIREAVLFKTLGATRHAVARVLATEYLLIGTLAGLVGSLAAAGLSWGLVRFVFEGQWELMPLPYLAAWGGTSLVIMAAGLASSLDVLLKKPLQVLREE
ncbi:MAG: ABC transporter permease [SAR324 cluster bacterium]|nr:ABC transporter permease [SAR324 cluster bacterium]